MLKKTTGAVGPSILPSMHVGKGTCIVNLRAQIRVRKRGIVAVFSQIRASVVIS